MFLYTEIVPAVREVRTVMCLVLVMTSGDGEDELLMVVMMIGKRTRGERREGDIRRSFQ